jgi:hypothetical protein
MSYESANNSSDPYRQKNVDSEAPLDEKVTDLVKFIETTKLGMMTTRQSNTGCLVSRCMSLAGTVSASVSRQMPAHFSKG